MGLLEDGEIETFGVIILDFVGFAELPLITWLERGLDKSGAVTFVDVNVGRLFPDTPIESDTFLLRDG